ncbi:hypothetical protein [Rhodococcus koreensis]
MAPSRTGTRVAKGSSAAHRGNAFTAVVEPAAGRYSACVGPADRYVEVREPSHGYYYYDETGEFWTVRLLDHPAAVVDDALDTAATAVAHARTALESLGRDLPRAERWLQEASESLTSARTEGTPDQAARSAVLAESSRRLRLACNAP